VSYLVLARKYRPQTFEDLVGQDHVARTLANAIGTGRIAHAFLFTGVRGVGKTTSARLLAKCLSCVGADGKATGPTATPCNKCSPCQEITAGQDLDVQEIDGASYNGVDEVRRLQEGTTFRPARDRFKIYIVDEVHMLSTAAWNAFLKTLEEPPPHVKFIFATTEVHKVPATILSRCQRYDFKLIPTQAVAKRLDEVLKLEKIEADGPAVQVLAREAAGSMRDAMSLLDQVIAFSGNKLTGEDVAKVLGVADRKILHDLASALLGGDAAACLGVVDRLAQQGFDLAHVAKDVLQHLRNLVVAKVAGKGDGAGPSLRELLDLADEEMADVTALAAQAEIDDVTRLFQGFSRAFDEVARSGQPRMALEMALVRLARRPPLLPLDELLSRVGELEKRLGGAPPPGPAPRGGGGGGGRSLGNATSISQASSPAPGPGPAPAPLGDVPGPRTHGALALAAPATMASPSPVATAAAVSVAPAAAPAAAPAVVAPAPDIEIWRAILDRLRKARPALASILEHAFPLELGPARAVIGFDATAAFFASRASEPEALEALTREIRGHFGAPTAVALDLSARPPQGLRTVASVDEERRAADVARARASIEEHQLVQEAKRLFGATVRDVKLPSGEG
jgi:DNA polymerase-3 subunit gamma/tau